MVDIDRVLLKFSEKMKNGSYQKLIFSFKFTKKFFIKGDYFKKLGEEFSSQNHAYTIRTFAENIYKVNGERAFGTWTGGLIGVLTEQMDDHNEFHKEWYLEEWAKSH